MSSVTNFAVVVVAAVSLSPDGFGVFAATYTLFTILVSGIQALVSQELVLTSGSSSNRYERCRESLMLSLVLGLVTGAVLVALSFLFGSMRDSLILLAVFLPLLFLQDTLRFAASTVGRMGLALMSDCLWLTLSAILIIGAAALGMPDNPESFVVYWAAGGVIAGLVLVPFFSPLKPLPDLRRFRHRKFLGYRFFMEFVAIRATAQSLVLVLGWMAGLAATGSVRGATTLFGPLGVLIMAAGSFGAPILRGLDARRRESALALAGFALVAATAALAAALFLMPSSWGEVILGETWNGARSLVPAIATQTALLALTTSVFLGLRLVEPESTLRVRLIASACLIPLFFAGYAWNGVTGAVWGIALSNVVTTVIGFRVYLSLRAGGRSLASLGQEEAARDAE